MNYTHVVPETIQEYTIEKVKSASSKYGYHHTQKCPRGIETHFIEF